MLLDVLLIIIVVLSVYIGYRRGAAQTVVSFVCSLLAFIIATFLGDLIATVLYDNYIGQSVLSNVSQYTSTAQSVTVAPTVETLPSFVKFLVDFTGYEANQSLIDAVKGATDTVAGAVTTALKPLVVSVVSFILTTIFYIIIHFVFKRLLVKPITAIFKLPVINKIDSILGMIFSLLFSLLIISFLAFILRLLLPFIENVPDFMSEETIYNSYIFKHFYSGNIFFAITSLF